MDRHLTRLGMVCHPGLSHWGRVTHICVVKLTIIGSDNGLSPGRRQAIIRTNAEILLIGPLGTKFSEIVIEIYTFSFKKTHLKISSGKWRPFCFSLNVLYVRSNLQVACRWRHSQLFAVGQEKCRCGAWRPLVRRQAITWSNVDRLIVSWTFGNKLLWNLYQNIKFFVQQNEYMKMSSTK